MINKVLIPFMLILFSSSVLAGSWDDFKSEFEDLMEGLIKFGEQAERDYTLGQLTKLHRDLLRIERSKEDLIFILKKPNIFGDNLEETLTEAKSSTESARNRLKNIGDRVARLSNSASQLEQILSESIRSRKSWLSQVDLSNARSSKHLIEEGEKAVKALNSSRKALEQYLRSVQIPTRH
tara:strand:- start:1820 stop:2359 length:540 start_codon:yes stop_codon:yes gene_type:complete